VKTGKKKTAKKKKKVDPTKSSAIHHCHHWLMKSEPETYSIDDFARESKTLWTGVRNYQARNFMMTGMHPGDRFLFYHSNADPSAITGVGRILRVNIPDPTALNPESADHDPKASEDHPIWFCAEVAYEGHVRKVLSLAELKSRKELAGMALLQKGSRLSVQPVTKAEFDLILEMAGGIVKNPHDPRGAQARTNMTRT